MSDENSFDELVRQKLEQRSFEPGPGSWEKAERLIDSERREKRFPWFGWKLTASIVAVIAGAFTVIYFTTDSPSDPKIVAEQSSVSKNSDRPDPEHHRAAAGSTSSSNQPGTGESVPTAPGFSSTASNDDTAANGASSPGVANKNPVTHENAPTEKNATRATPPAASQKSTAPEKQITATPKKEKPSRSSKPRDPVVKKPVTDRAATTTARPDPVVREATTEWKHPDAAQPNIDTAMQRLSAAQPNIDTAWQRLNAAQPNIDTAMQRLTRVEQQPDTAMQRLTAAQPDSDSTMNDVPPPPPVSNGKANYWFAEAGLHFIPASRSLSRSFNPVVGGGYCFHLGANIGLQLGLNYTFIGNISDSSKVYTTTVYSFGVEQQHTEIGLKRLHYVAMPVTFQWHFSGRSALFGGVTANYLLATESRERTYLQEHNTIKNDKTCSVFGYEQGINRFDVLLTAGYARTFGPHWSLQAAAFTGLIDLKQNSFYGGELFERNCGFRLTLQYGF